MQVDSIHLLVEEEIIVQVKSIVTFLAGDVQWFKQIILALQYLVMVKIDYMHLLALTL